MNHWWRAYNEAVNDPKLQLLSDVLFRAWFNLMCIASQNDGALPPVASLAFTLRMKPERAIQVLAQLASAGLLDKTETGFTPHNWNGRQYKSDVSTDRVKRFRETKRNVSPTVSETPPETEQKQIDSEANASGADAPVDPTIAEREFFARGREVLGKASGGLLAKLLKAKAGNVAIARASLETASQKQNPNEFVAACCRDGPVAKPLTEHQKRQHEAKGILDELDDFATGSGGSNEADIGLLGYDPGGRSQGFRGRTGGDIVDLSPRRSRQGG